MKQIDENKQRKIKGGFSVWTFAGITALIAFLVGVIEGYTNPKICDGGE